MIGKFSKINFGKLGAEAPTTCRSLEENLDITWITLHVTFKEVLNILPFGTWYTLL